LTLAGRRLTSAVGGVLCYLVLSLAFHLLLSGDKLSVEGALSSE